jgi:hypothetical protein
MKEITPIGGFIGLELFPKNFTYHEAATPLSNARACFNLLLQKLKPTKVYLPYYCCKELKQPLIINNVPHAFYHLDHILNPVFTKGLKPTELFLYINYFDIKNKAVSDIEKKFKTQLIVDNTQAFFQRQYKFASSFNSCRKFFGVPDGGYLYTRNKIKSKFPTNTQYNFDFLISRALENGKVYYAQFLENEKKQTSDIKMMSHLTSKILSQIDYGECRIRRLENFNFLHEYFSIINKLKIDMASVGVPQYYPLLLEKPIPKTKLIEEKLYIPTLWPEISKLPKNKAIWEIELAKDLLPLPVDQSYSLKHMRRVIKIIKKYL